MVEDAHVSATVKLISVFLGLGEDKNKLIYLLNARNVMVTSEVAQEIRQIAPTSLHMAGYSSKKFLPT